MLKERTTHAELQELRLELADTQARLTALLRENEARKAFLLHLNDVLGPLTDPIRIQFEAARILGRHLGADRAYYGHPEAEYRLTGSSAAATGSEGRPFFVTDTGVSHSVADETRAAYRALGLRTSASAA